MKELVNDRSSCLSLLSYQGKDRQFFMSMKRVAQPSGQIERRQGYKDCLKGTGSVGKMQHKWIIQDIDSDMRQLNPSLKNMESLEGVMEARNQENT